MNKQELISKIAEKAGISKKDAGVALTALTATITEELKAGEKIAISNLGIFEVRERAARTGHNPRTGETVEIAAKRIPAFKAAKALKDAVE
ncbi:MAG: HU family DNA-binding protein [Clostridia bacterium]|nr:HU family DNA-binding protein [Clostridia bacterium]